MESFPMTRSGRDKLEAELKKLKSNDRPNVIKEIATARAHGDLSENAEYDAAKEKQAFIEGRIQEIEDKLARAEVIDPKDIQSDQIKFGATVELMDLESEEQKTYQLVGQEEADVKEGRLSIQSPIAKALLNKKVGDEVTVKVPKGEVEYEVLSIRYE
ncbi:MAG: transcription elongation factor GreA [Bdellovibrionaceae bacterium]|nr:transcription elongation factor GreA [Bdellovibrionales bacterium]MCB9254376.1 transcription elongation factor GreA [Pseudobdellovibrionaceae bacterium]